MPGSQERGQKSGARGRGPGTKGVLGEAPKPIIKFVANIKRNLLFYGRPGSPRVLFFDEEVPPLNEAELAFEIDNKDYGNYRFRKFDIEKYIKKEIT